MLLSLINTDDNDDANADGVNADDGGLHASIDSPAMSLLFLLMLLMLMLLLLLLIVLLLLLLMLLLLLLLSFGEIPKTRKFPLFVDEADKAPKMQKYNRQIAIETSQL